MKVTIQEKFNKLVAKIVKEQLSNQKILLEAFASPELSKLWKLIKSHKWGGQKEFFKILRRRQHLGPVAWDKIPADAVERISKDEAKNRKDAINIWVTKKTESQLRAIGIQHPNGYGDLPLPILAVTRGKKMLWSIGHGSKRSSIRSSDSRMGAVGVPGMSFKGILPGVDYVISIDIVKAKMTDTSDIKSDRAERKKGTIHDEELYKKTATRYIDSDRSSTGRSYWFTVDAMAGMKKLNQERYRKIIADRVVKAGAENADKLIKLAMAISNELTAKFVKEKPTSTDSWGDKQMKFSPDDRYGFTAKDIVDTLSRAFGYYQDAVKYHDLSSGTDGERSSSYARQYKQSLDSLNRYVKDMVKYKNTLK